MPSNDIEKVDSSDDIVRKNKISAGGASLKAETETSTGFDEEIKHSTTTHTNEDTLEIKMDPALPVVTEAPVTPANVNPKDARFWLLIMSVLVVTFVAALDLCSLPTILPTIAKDLNAPTFMWVASAYLLTSVAFIPPAVTLASIFGRRDPLLAACLLFAVGSVVCGSAHSMNIMIIGRALQGAAGGPLMSLGSMVIVDVTSLAERETFLGLTAFAWVLAAMLGPVIGAGFAMHTTWRDFFYLNIPLVGVAALCVALFLKVKVPVLTRQEKLRRFDWAVFLFVAASTSFIIGLSFGGSTYSWSSPRTLVPLVVGAAGLAFWVFVESKMPFPTVPWEILRHRGSITGYTVCLTTAMVQLMYIFFTTVFFQSVQGSTAMRAAVQTFTFSISTFIAVFTGIYTKKTHSFVNPMILGCLLLAVGTGLMSLLKNNCSPAVWIIIPLIGSCAVGMLSTTPQFAIMSPLPPRLQAQSAGFFVVVRTIGQLLGVSIGGTILQNQINRRVPSEFLSQFPHNGSQAAYTAIPYIKTLGEPLRTKVRVAYADSLRVIWLTGMALAIVGLVAALLTKRLALTDKKDDEFGMIAAKKAAEAKEPNVEEGLTHHSSEKSEDQKETQRTKHPTSRPCEAPV